MGDELDRILNEVTSQGYFDGLVRECVAEVHGDTTEWDAYQRALRSAESTAELENAGAPSGESGIAAEALATALGTDSGRPAIPELSQSLLATLQGEPGDEEGGCLRMAETARLKSPSEQARMVLQNRYIEDITSRILLEPAVRDAYRSWAECMSAAGFEGLERPGDHFALIDRRVAEANGDIAELKQAQVLDRAASTSNARCLDFSRVMSVQSTVRAEYERSFVEENRADIEKLILLLREQEDT